MDYETILKKYRKACEQRQLSEEYLRENDCEVRSDLPVAIEFSYGVIYLRDDAVDVLIKRIEELEAELQELRGTIKAMKAWERRVDKAR